MVSNRSSGRGAKCRNENLVWVLFTLGRRGPCRGSLNLKLGELIRLGWKSSPAKFGSLTPETGAGVSIAVEVRAEVRTAVSLIRLVEGDLFLFLVQTLWKCACDC